MVNEILSLHFYLFVSLWIFFHFSLHFAAAFGHESVELSILVPLRSFPSSGISYIAVSLPIEDLYEVSTSVLEAEKWPRTKCSSTLSSHQHDYYSCWSHSFVPKISRKQRDPNLTISQEHILLSYKVGFA
ncbi:hypothetical protein RND71_033888 [Anisodus tanguticus]|uniref:Uncharacterized protein n=1 Tax=Anisodus tanguticus TaxID=243964 RepID=A0AAE1R8I7_9SOLA|nr:hypothetical protein RND71_033888 [Anisodus tanguticus]